MGTTARSTKRRDRQPWTVPPDILDAVLSIQDMWAVGGFDVTSGDVERLSGRQPRSLADVLAAKLGRGPDSPG